MVRHPSPELVEVSRELACVRVADMRGVDLSTFVFDYDLTFAVLLMHSDGHVFHQYGNRTPDGAESHLSMASLARVMRATVRENRAYSADTEHRRTASPAEYVEQLPTMLRRAKSGKAPDCYHCHTVNQARDEQAREDGSFDPGVAWRWPPSTRVGLRLDRDDQQLVVDVTAGSPAAAAGLGKGDRLVSVGGRGVLTEGDVQWELDGVPASGGDVPVEVARGDGVHATVLRLQDGWRAGAPEELWRATMWRLDPQPGFGGPLLSAAEKEELGVGAGVSAFRVKYVVTWGDRARTGRNALEAGLRKGDVVLSVGGKSDFRSPQHFHAWFRLTRKVGETVPVEVLREGRGLTIELPVIE